MTDEKDPPKPGPSVVTPSEVVEPAAPALEAAARPEQPVDVSAPSAAGMRPQPGLDAPIDPAAVAASDTAGLPAPVADDDVILPPAYEPEALRDAVGAPVRSDRDTPPPVRRSRLDDDDDDTPRPRGRRTVAIAAGAIIGGLGIAALVFLGRANGQRYAIACTPTQVSAEQGRAFPPWGTRPLTGPEWKPVSLPANAECKPRETDDRAELEHWYLDLLIDRASTTLTQRNLLDTIQQGKTNPLDVVTDQLNQALLLSRAPERRDERKEVERMQGDVQYWRAQLKLRDANAALLDAAKQFEAAAAQRPRHVTDAAQWGSFLHRLSDDLHAGPGGVAPAPGPAAAAASDRPQAPPGVALPVEPEGSDAEPAAPADAGLPTGGVLL